MTSPDLLPADGRFGSGPSKIRPRQLNTLAGSAAHLLGTSHRRLPVRNLVGEVREMLRAHLEVPEDHEIVLGNGGAAAFWDVAVFSLVRERSAHAVCGEFGAKFAAEATGAPFLQAPAIIEAPPGQGAYFTDVPDADTLAYAHNETSTGVQVPLARPQGVTEDQLLVVDGTSIAGGTRGDLTGIDAYFFAPQKCLGSDGGLWLAALSPAAVERAARIAATDRWVPAILSLPAAVTNSRQNQTLNTPAIATLVLLREQLRWLLDQGGAQFADRRTRESSQVLYDWAEASPFAAPFVGNRDERSQVVVTIDLDATVDVNTMTADLRTKGIVDIEAYRGLGRNQIRVATFPSIDTADVQALTGCIDAWVARRG